MDMERSGAEKIMKKIIALIVVIMALPTVSAYAASISSRHFVVRNWKAAISTDGNLPAEGVDEDHTEKVDGQAASPAEETEPVDEQPIPPAEETGSVSAPEDEPAPADAHNEDGTSTESEQEAAMESVENEPPVDDQATPLAEDPIPTVVDVEPEDERPADDEPGEPTVNDHSGEEIAPEAEQGEARVDIGEAEGELSN